MIEVFWFIGIIRCLVQAIEKRNLEHRMPKWVQLPHDFYAFQAKITSLKDVIDRIGGATDYIFHQPGKTLQPLINANTFKYTNRDFMWTTIPTAHKLRRYQAVNPGFIVKIRFVKPLDPKESLQR